MSDSFSDYRLPDGRIVSASAGTSLPVIPYQLADGRVVMATRACSTKHTRRAEEALSDKDAERKNDR
jgi:hypothetical protein